MSHTLSGTREGICIDGEIKPWNFITMPTHQQKRHVVSLSEPNIPISTFEK